MNLSSLPDPDLLRCLRGLRSMGTLRRAIGEWVPRDLTCLEGSTVDDMAFPPALFSELSSEQVDKLQLGLQIPRARRYSHWACHFLDMNVYYGRRKKVAARISSAIAEVVVKGPTSLPVGACLLLVTYAAMEQDEAQWRSDVAAVIKQDSARTRKTDRQLLRACSQILDYLDGATGRVRSGHPLDLLTRSGRIITWKGRVRFQSLLSEFEGIVRSDPNADVVVPRVRSDKTPDVNRVWGILRDMAKSYKTMHTEGEVASSLLKVAGVHVRPETADRQLRRGQPPQKN